MRFCRYLAICAVLVLLVFPGCGGGQGNSNSNSGGPPPQSNPLPAISSIDPSSATAGTGSGITLTVNGSNFISTSTVQWNGISFVTSYVSSAKLTVQPNAAVLADIGTATVDVVNPSPGGGMSNSVAFAITLPPQVSALKILANDLAWDPVNQVVYLSLPSSAGVNGNSIQVLDPASGVLDNSALVGNEPNLLSVSSTSKYLYVSQDGAPTIERMTLPDLLPDITIPLGSDSFLGPYYALDLQAAPNADNTVAVARKVLSASPDSEGAVIYDDATQRANSLCDFGAGCIGPPALYDSLQWNSDATEIFSVNNEDTGFDFYTAPVTTTGFVNVTDYRGLAGGFGELIHYDAATGYVYDDDGKIFDPSNGTVVGSFPASGIMIPDGQLGTAFFVGQVPEEPYVAKYAVESFNIHTFTPISLLPIADVIGTPTHIIRWGSDGLAFLTYNPNASPPTGTLYIIKGSFVTGSSRGPGPKQNVHRGGLSAPVPVP